MESSGGYGSRSSFRAVARKLLQAAEAPSPARAQLLCHDVQTGAPVRCPNPRTLLIILVGMSCMMMLVTIASLLLCLFPVRQRRLDERRRAQQQQQAQAEPPQELTGLAPPRTSSTTQSPALSPEYDDAVLVQLPGDEKPHFFALPKPFPAKDESSVKPEPDDVATSGPKDPLDDEPDASDPCVLYRNPLFDSQ